MILDNIIPTFYYLSVYETMTIHIILLLLAVPTVYTCYAPPFEMGYACNAGPELFGLTSTAIRYRYNVEKKIQQSKLMISYCYDNFLNIRLIF